MSQVQKDVNFVNAYQKISVWANLYGKKCNQWQNNTYNLPKLRTYVLFKGNFCVEPYIRVNTNRQDRSVLAKLSFGILMFEIEIRRWKNVDVATRFCQLCHSEVEDEHHFMFNCNQYILINK